MPSVARRALALLSLLLVAQLAVLRGAMQCASATDARQAAATLLAAHDAHGAGHHAPGRPHGDHLPGATCPAMTVCALVALPSVHDDRPADPDAIVRVAAGPESPRAWAPRAPEPPPPRG